MDGLLERRVERIVRNGSANGLDMAKGRDECGDEKNTDDDVRGESPRAPAQKQRCMPGTCDRYENQRIRGAVTGDAVRAEQRIRSDRGESASGKHRDCEQRNCMR